MARAGRLATALCFSSVLACAQQDPLAWFPLKVGNRWVYEHESKSGNRNQPQVDRFTTEEIITGTMPVPEGLVVLRDVRQQGNTAKPQAGYLIARDRQPYLVHGNCIYVIGGAWDEFRKYLSEGAGAPDFCFPLQIGRRWGNGDISWQVAPAGAGVHSLHVFTDHFGSGGRKDVWFRKGVGVVAEHYVHSGTYDEYTKTLLSFTPARQR